MILLLGGDGYVGRAFKRLLDSRKVPFQAPVRREMDCSSRAQLRDFLRQYRPEFVINAAGYTGKPNVDASEAQKLRCLEDNVIVPGVIGEVCEKLEIPWGHVSSGCIYNGARPDGRGFTEEDTPNFTFRQNNCSFYSGTKALAEEVLLRHDRCYIWRLRIPFNEVAEARNYLHKLVHYERVVDVANSISQLDEFTRACLECWLHRVPFGVYNVTNPGFVTTREVTEMIAEHGLARKAFQFFRDEEEFHREVTKTRRASCILDSSKLLRAGIVMTEIHEAIEWALAHWRQPDPAL